MKHRTPLRRRNAHIRRYRQIARVLARHGMGYLASATGLDRFLPHRGSFGQARGDDPYTPPEHVRMAIEELGATFIKLGQILSTRSDLLPPEYLAELAKLQDAAPRVPWEAIREVLAAELGRPPEEAFASVDPNPLAAGSIGQAHAATLHDGTDVVVKVRRPGVVRQVEQDLEILQNLAASAARRWQFANQYDLVGLSQEFATTLSAELDYIREGRNAERFAANFANETAVHIPRIFWETTTTRVLTVERIRGIKINDLAGLDAAGVDRKALAVRAANIIFKMTFDDGFFHADPHPGNFFIEPSGRIGMIDFGMVGLVDEHMQQQLVEIVLAITSNDSDRMVDTFLELGVAHGRVDRGVLSQDLQQIVTRYYGQSLGETNVTALLNDSFAVVRRHHLQLPSNLLLLVKTIMMNEGLGAQLDPEFDLTTVLTPYARRLIIRQNSPDVWAKRLGQASIDLGRLGVELPQQLRRVMGQMERGGLEVSMRPENFEPVIRRMERLGNRIVLGIIAAAFINGLAVLMAFYNPPGLQQWIGVLITIGFILAGGLGMYLAWSILRSGRG